MTVRAAAEQLRINYGSAKSILRVYKKSGRVERIFSPHYEYTYKLDL